MNEYDERDYFFDLRGYLVLERALSPELVSMLNAALDAFPHLELGHWHGNVQRLDNNGRAGLELQNIVEAGWPFEELIDHAAWIDLVRRYCGEFGNYYEGLFIDECLASIRRSGGYFPLHSGHQDGMVRTQYSFRNGRFRCGMVNILMALTDIGPGDGGTVIIPGSHKSNLPHPVLRRPFAERVQQEREKVDVAIEVHLKAGDALLFVDDLAHGASARINPGERRVVIYRYGPRWGTTRYGYRYSDEFIARLTPHRRQIMQPIAPRVPGVVRGKE